MSQFRAVIFDLGGVVLDSPFSQFYLLEQRLGLEKHTISKARTPGRTLCIVLIRCLCAEIGFRWSKWAV